MEFVDLNYKELGEMSIGLIPAGYPLYKLPGTVKKGFTSYGYRGNGQVVRNKTVYGQGVQLIKGDVLGLGLVNCTRTLFFTLNGKLQQIGLRDYTPGEYYPSIGFFRVQFHANFNFGERPFKFNVNKYRQQL